MKILFGIGSFVVAVLIWLTTLFPPESIVETETPISAGARAAVVKITYLSTAKCRAVAISPRAFLGASHCEAFAGPPLELNGESISIVNKLSDGNDHTIYLLARWHGIKPVRLHRAPLVPGQEVYFFGYGHGHDRLLRLGYYSGLYDLDDAPRPASGTHSVHLFAFGTAAGDSGGPIFNRWGRLVGIVSLSYRIGDLSMAGMFPLAFTLEQWHQAGVR